MTADPISIVIVEDHEILSESLAVALRGVGLAVEVAGDLHPHAIVETVRTIRPDVTLLDLHLGGTSTSIDIVADLVAVGTVVVVLTATDDPVLIGAALRAGALDVVRKSQPFDQLVRVVRDAAAGVGGMSRSRRLEVVRAWERTTSEQRPLLGRFAGLTAQESIVLGALLAGRSPAEIAEERYVAVSTVRSQLKAIYRKLGVNSQLAAVALARRAGWQPPA